MLEADFQSTHFPHEATLRQRVVQRDVQLLQDGENALSMFSAAMSTSNGNGGKTGLIAAPFLLLSAFTGILLLSSRRH